MCEREEGHARNLPRIPHSYSNQETYIAPTTTPQLAVVIIIVVSDIMFVFAIISILLDIKFFYIQSIFELHNYPNS